MMPSRRNKSNIQPLFFHRFVAKPCLRIWIADICLNSEVVGLFVLFAGEGGGCFCCLSDALGPRCGITIVVRRRNGTNFSVLFVKIYLHKFELNYDFITLNYNMNLGDLLDICQIVVDSYNYSYSPFGIKPRCAVCIHLNPFSH